MQSASGILRTDLENADAILRSDLEQQIDDVSANVQSNRTDFEQQILSTNTNLQNASGILDQKIDNSIGTGSVTYTQAAQLAKKWAIILG